MPCRRTRRRVTCSTSASTRAGLPDPDTIGSGPAITTAPVAGSRARFCSWVSPYLPAPSRKEWHGKAGSKECAVPASVPTVSTPTPDHRRLLGQPLRALDRDARSVRAGLVRVRGRRRRLRCGHPSRCGRSSQPPSGSGPCSASQARMCVDLQQEVGVLRGAAAEKSSTAAGATSLAAGTCETSSPSRPVIQCIGRVEVGAGVLAGGDVVPVPGRAALVEAADLGERERRRRSRTAAAAAGSACRCAGAR